MRTMSLGARGQDVRDVQSRLGALGYRLDPDEPGAFGKGTERAVREFQQGRSLLVDGRVGQETWEELVEAGYSLGDRVLYLRYPYVRGDDVRELQARLNLLGFDTGRQDGIFGERTDRAVRDFQTNVGLRPDGIVGGTSYEALTRLRPVGPGPGRAAVREGEILRRLSASIDGASIGVDAAHGPEEPGATGPTGLTEGEATVWLAEELAEELARRGAAPFLIRTAGEQPDTAERVRRANQEGAEVLISLHLNSHPDPAAQGAAAYFYGREDYVSRAGQRLAELILEALTSQLGRTDLRTHAKSLPLLRETRMPTVHVEPCFITNPQEEAWLREPAFRRKVAVALADGIERFFRAGIASRDAGETGLSTGRGAPSDRSASAAAGSPPAAAVRHRGHDQTERHA
jgi:N-acetylmuramoyl-L-alanine amidase